MQNTYFHGLLFSGGICDNGGDMSDQMIWWHNQESKDEYNSHQNNSNEKYDPLQDDTEMSRDTGDHHINQLKKVIFDHVNNQMKKWKLVYCHNWGV